jgi:hypothetical protein
MLKVVLDVTISLEGPVISKSTAAGGYGIDAPMARNFKGRYYIPGTLVKGHLLQSWQELSETTKGVFNPGMSKLLGKRSEKDEKRISPSTVDPERGIVHFSDFINEKHGQNKRLYRIRIDTERKSVESGSFQVIEAPFAPGECVRFKGTISYNAPNLKEADEIQKNLELGLCWTTSFGADRTTGFGRLINVEFSRTTHDYFFEKFAPASGRKTIGLAIRPLAPFCISNRRIADNLFESVPIIPGGVIKGCVASMWGELLGVGPNAEICETMDKDRPELCKNFDIIRFSHAFPATVRQRTRPVIPPLSLVKVDDKGYYDVALCEKPVLIKNRAPKFSVNWKKRDDIDKEFGWPMLERELRVRTALNRHSRKAEDKQLFAYEMIIPDGRQWYSSIDLSAIADEKERKETEEQLLSIISKGLNGWGKTKVSAKVTFFEPDEIRPHVEQKFIPMDDNLFVITLQTPALLCNPADLNETSGADELLCAYREVWSQMSGSSLRLERFFAQQSLMGGEYLHKKFQGKNYKPYLLTDAGSVFLLKSEPGKEKSARMVIHDWLRRGLRLPEWAEQEYSRNGKPGSHWSNCPYILENGHGEIVVNLKVHWDKQPEEVSDVI